MKKEALYKTLAKYYDLIYTWKDYEKEAKVIKKLISKNKLSTGKQLLDVEQGVTLSILLMILTVLELI